MPFPAIASATDLIRSSLTLQANLFQLFQPIGGVWARESRSECAPAWLESRMAASSSQTKRCFAKRFIERLPVTFPSDEERALDSLGSMPGEYGHSEHIFPV